MPWEKSYDRTEVLDRAMRAFWARGYEATSISDLTRATGINRGSLYSAYSDKRDLFLAALKHYDRRHRQDFLTGIEQGRGPRAAILGVFEQAAFPSARNDTPTGCLLINTALEMSPHDPEIATLIDRCLTGVETFFARKITEGQAAGEISRAVRTGPRAQALLGLFMGLRVATRAGRGDAMLRAILSQAGEMLPPPG